MMKFGVKYSILLLATSAVPLLLGGCVEKSKYDELAERNNALEMSSKSMAQQIADNTAQIARLRGAIIYTMNSDLLFRSGSWQLSEEGQEDIGRVAHKLAPTQEVTLVVNGYTDNKPIGAALKNRGVSSNQELSQKRAEAVMQYMISQGVKADLVKAQGFGEANPVAPNDTAEGREQNRRVEIAYAEPGKNMNATP